MRINNIDNKLSFQSGLSKSLIKDCKNIDVNKVECDLFLKNISSNLKSSKPLAFATINVVKIFESLKHNLKINMFDITSPSIQAYKIKDLCFNFIGYGFCLPETQTILKNENPFKTGTIFFEEENDIEYLNSKIDRSFQNKERSSSHYLAPFVHEFLHSAYINYIYTKYGYEGQCPYTLHKYRHKDNNCGLKVMTYLKNLRFNDFENEIIFDNLGKYAVMSQNQYHEVFAEAFTQIICKSLSDNDSMPIKNPLDEMKNYSKEFLCIIKKLFI